MTKEEKRAYNREWAKNNPEKMKAAQAKYRITHAEEIKERKRLRRLTHPPDKEYNARKMREWRKRNPEKVKENNRLFKLENPHYSRLKAGLPEPTRPCPDTCENCGRPSINRDLAWDHDHETGKFRGFLCMKCNTAIGMLGDNEEGLMRAVNYIRRAKNEP